MLDSFALVDANKIDNVKAVKRRDHQLQAIAARAVSNNERYWTEPNIPVLRSDIAVALPPEAYLRKPLAAGIVDRPVLQADHSRLSRNCSSSHFNSAAFLSLAAL